MPSSPKYIFIKNAYLGPSRSLPEDPMPNHRREFLKNIAGTVVAFTILPRHVLGRGYLAPSDQLTKGIIGTGVAGRQFLNYPGTRVTALCDVNQANLAQAAALLDKKVKTFDDYRHLLLQKDIDFVHIATPPHWHGLMAIEAAAAGKDIWCETPMTHSIAEGRQVITAVQTYGRIFRLNLDHRIEGKLYGTNMPVKKLQKLISSAILGGPITITLGPQTGFNWPFQNPGLTSLPAQPIPATLNYDRWLGPAPYKPYHINRIQHFPAYWDYSGGILAELGQQYLDPIQFILGKDETSPVEVAVEAPLQHPDVVGTWQKITFTYEDGCKIILDAEGREANAPFISGPAGKLYADFKSDIRDLETKLADFPDPPLAATDFVKAVKERQTFATNEENGHRSCTLVNMGIIALQLGRSLQFDPVKQTFLFDEGANRLLNKALRSTWK
ncbi:Predicted dehydrogenase [Chitinophaga sancti]|uniref:Predicted dehydrogenase n=2 Tax=Chitinophaga sancti TaxID=1004 RepID=A0A1K1LMC3_9BACT|nr:Predicted dehydrogenase [Chitinophaga sancti]